MGRGDGRLPEAWQPHWLKHTALITADNSAPLKRVCLDITVQGRAFSDKKDDLRVKNIVIYLRVEKKRWKKMPFKWSALPQGMFT